MIKTYKIDELKRTITPKGSEKYPSVVIGDKDINGIEFEFPDSFEHFDLYAGVKYVSYVTPDGQEKSKLLTDIIPETGLLFWKFDDSINKGKPGQVVFALVIDQVENEETVKTWVSLETKFSVVKSLAMERRDDPEEEVTYAERLAAAETALANMQRLISGLASGAPAVAPTAAAMTDTEVIYIYTGSETGYSSGHLYYYDGSAWVDFGQYGSAAPDPTLSIQGSPADAAAVGEALEDIGDDIEDIKEDLSSLGDGLSEEAKAAILDCVSSMAWADTSGQAKYNALVAALDPHAYPLSIAAVYTQSGAVYPFTPLDNLKADLVVTASMSDGTTQTIGGTQYALSGTLAEGTSTITVTYSGKTATFEVTVSEAVPLTISNALLRATTSNATTQAANGDAYTATITPETGYAIGYAKVTMGGVDITSTVYNNGVINIPSVTGYVDIRVFALYAGASVPAEYTEYDYVEGLDSAHTIATSEIIRTPAMAKSLDSVNHEFLYERKSGAVETSYTERLFGSRKSANSLTGATMYYVHNGYINPSARGNGTLNASALNGVVHSIMCINGATSPSIVSVDGTSYEMAWDGETSTAKSAIAPFCGMIGVNSDGASRMGQNRLGRVTIYDEGTPILDLRPVIRISDNRIGWYNTVTQAFMTCTSETAATVGEEGCLYAVGNWG